MSREKFSLVENMPHGFLYHRIIFEDEGKFFDFESSDKSNPEFENISNYEFEFVYANTAFEEITGFPGEEIVGKNLSELKAMSNLETETETETETAGFDWTGIYEKLNINDVTGKGTCMEEHFKSTDRWY